MLERSQRRRSLHQVRRAAGLCPWVLALCFTHSHHLAMLIANHCLHTRTCWSVAIMLQAMSQCDHDVVRRWTCSKRPQLNAQETEFVYCAHVHCCLIETYKSFMIQFIRSRHPDSACTLTAQSTGIGNDRHRTSATLTAHSHRLRYSISTRKPRE